MHISQSAARIIGETVSKQTSFLDFWSQPENSGKPKKKKLLKEKKTGDQMGPLLVNFKVVVEMVVIKSSEVLSLKVFKRAFFLGDCFLDLTYHVHNFFINRSSRLRYSVKQSLLRISQYSQKENFCWNLFLKSSRSSPLQGSNFIKRSLQERCFSVNIRRTFVLSSICEWMLLHQIELFMWHHCNIVCFTILKDIVFVMSFFFKFQFFCYIIICY